jgi:hypothetical protein
MMSRKNGALAELDHLIDTFKSGAATDEDAAAALELLKDPNFKKSLQTDIKKAGGRSMRDEEDDDEDDDRRSSDDDDDENEGDEEDTPPPSPEDDEDEPAEDAEEPPRRGRRFGKAIVPDLGGIEMFEGPDGEQLLNMDGPLTDLAKAVQTSNQQTEECLSLLVGELRELRKSVRDGQAGMAALRDQLAEIVQMAEVQEAAEHALPVDLQKSITDQLEEYRTRAEQRFVQLEDAIGTNPPGRHGRMQMNGQDAGDGPDISKAACIEIFKKGFDTDKLSRDKFREAVRALDGRGVDPVEIAQRYYPKGLREYIEAE